MVIEVEKKAEAEAWLARVNDLVPDAADVETWACIQREAYRAGAIAVMEQTGYDDAQKPHRDNLQVQGISHRLSDHLQSAPIVLNDSPFPYAVGTARDHYYSRLPAFLGGRQPRLAREQFYIRELKDCPSDKAPDIQNAAWILPWQDVQLPDKDEHLVANRRQMARFGREMAQLAITIGCELPETREEIQAAALKEISL